MYLPSQNKEHCIVLYCVVLCCVVLCCVVLCWVVLCCVVLYYIVLYCIEATDVSSWSKNFSCDLPCVRSPKRGWESFGSSFSLLS